MKKKIVLHGLWIGMMIVVVFFFAKTQGGYNTDFLQEVFNPSIDKDLIIGGDRVGKTRDSVGRFLLKEGIEISLGTGIQKRPSFIVQLTQFLLKITVAVSVSMVIYNGILYIIKTQKGEHSKDLINNIIFIALGLLLALGSIIVIRLASSGASTLIEFTKTSNSQKNNLPNPDNNGPRQNNNGPRQNTTQEPDDNLPNPNNGGDRPGEKPEIPLQ